MTPTRSSLWAAMAAVAAATPASGAFTPERTDPDNCTGSGTSSQYSRCIARPAAASGSEDNTGGWRYCLPADDLPGSPTTLPTTLTIDQKSGNSLAVAVLEVENCRPRADKVQGEFSLVVDDSKSICWDPANRKGTDCSGKRIDLAQDLMGDLFGNAASTTPPSRLGIVAYGGRDGTTAEGSFNGDTRYRIDPDFTKTQCRDNDGGPDAYVQGRSPEIWQERSASGVYYSRCELLRPRDASGQSLLSAFLDMTGANPRGATDITYFLDAVQRNTMLGNASSGYGRNAIVITDGLPNIPKRIPRAECEKSPILMQALADMGGKFEKDPQGREYCYDRQFKHAANLANQYAEGRINFDFSPASDPNRFQTINVYNVLFVSDGYAYADEDYQTGEKLFPHDFLIENSARTGNGKVKFAYVRGATDGDRTAVEQALRDVFREHFDAHAVHHVTVKVGNRAAYNAVSRSEFQKGFGIKLVGLQTGTQTVTITTYYNDGQTKLHTMNVTVNATAGYSNAGEVSCSDADSTKTVDGDDPTDLRPRGDGVLPYANAVTGAQCRVFRNSDDANNLDRNREFNNPAGADSESVRAKAGRLRIQGGTGNCGVVASRDGQDPRVNPLLLLLPFLGVLVLRRKRR